MNSKMTLSGFESISRHFYDIKETCSYLQTSVSTYKRYEKQGLAPKGRKLFGRKKLYPILDIELFGKGEWHPQEVNS